jgi:predicted dehydrogenase
MAASPVRIGLIGYGKGGRYFHAPAIGYAEGCRLAGVVVRSPERRADAARDHPELPLWDSLAEVPPADVDAVVVSTPLDTHLALVREAIDRGLPVVCDKPFASDAASARDAVRAAERAGVLLSVYQNRRWDADFLTVRAVLASGDLGDVISFESRMEQYVPATGIPTTGGGVLLDLGSHAVDQATCLFGAVRSVYAELHTPPQEPGLDDHFFLALRHAGGVSSHVTGSLAFQGGRGPRFRVLGTTAGCVVEDDDGQTERVLAGRTPADDGAAWGTVPPSRWGSVHRAGVSTPVPSQVGAWEAFYTGFARGVRGEAAPPVDPWDAVATLAVLDAARVSATTGAVVPVEPTDEPAGAPLR